MTTRAKLSDKLYRWTKPDGGHDIGRIVIGSERVIGKITGVIPSTELRTRLMRCEFGHLYWVTGPLVEHDVSYRQKEKEAGQ